MDIVLVLSIMFFIFAPITYAIMIETDRRDFIRELEEEYGFDEEDDG